MTPEKLGSAELVEETSMPGATDKVVKATGVANPGRTSTILMRGGNKLVLEEAERSVHDALCVVRSLVKKRALISGGGSVETEVALKLGAWAKTQTGMKAYCISAYAEALELIPYTLAENAGLSPIAMVTELAAGTPRARRARASTCGAAPSRTCTPRTSCSRCSSTSRRSTSRPSACA